MASRITKKGWKKLYYIAGAIDTIQIVLDFFPPAGEGINAVADPIVGVIFAIYFQYKGVSMVKRPTRLLSLLCVTVIEEGTGGFAPTWIADMWYIRKTVPEDADEDGDIPPVIEGVRLPNKVPPLYEGGKGRPRTENIPPKIMVK